MEGGRNGKEREEREEKAQRRGRRQTREETLNHCLFIQKLLNNNTKIGLNRL